MIVTSMAARTPASSLVTAVPVAGSFRKRNERYQCPKCTASHVVFGKLSPVCPACGAEVGVHEWRYVLDKLDEKFLRELKITPEL